VTVFLQLGFLIVVATLILIIVLASFVFNLYYAFPENQKILVTALVLPACSVFIK
jgi:hypothetical protein